MYPGVNGDSMISTTPFHNLTTKLRRPRVAISDCGGISVSNEPLKQESKAERSDDTFIQLKKSIS